MVGRLLAEASSTVVAAAVPAAGGGAPVPKARAGAGPAGSRRGVEGRAAGPPVTGGRQDRAAGGRRQGEAGGR